MLFPTIQFATFFTVVFVGNWMLMRRPLVWRCFILAASYFFYGYWDYRFTALLAVSTLGNQFFARRIHAAGNSPARRWWLVGAVAANLGVLGFFKYYGFFVTSVIDSLRVIGLHPNPPLVQIILPVGISFFTFQAMSYVIDVFRDEIAPARNLEFAVYLAFFPQLVAGPIVRGTEFIPQMVRPRSPRNLDSSRAFYLIFIGLAKKVVIADFLATSIVDAVFASPGLHSNLAILFAVYGYAVQIYCDFSAYSDIAIGISILLGFKFPENFDAPYTALSIQDFWRRWHMTLSRWLRDYLYVPLGGSNAGRGRTYRNLMITMLLGGLWHGAAWKFVVWGGLHGGWLAWERYRQEMRVARGLPAVTTGPAHRALQRVVTFHLVCFAWIFFRADSMEVAWQLIWRLFTAWGSAPIVTPAVVLAIAVGIGAQYVSRPTVERALSAFSRLAVPAQGVALAFGLLVIDALGPQGVAAFIYFQF